MTTARYMVGDVHHRLAQLEAGSVDVAISSPPFLALRTYLPDSHPDKAREIGSEGTPAAFLDALLAWTAAVGRVLAPHGSLVVELGDTYAGSGGHGGDYAEGGWREGQPQFDGSAKAGRLADHSDGRGNPAGMRDTTFSGANTRSGGGEGWPLAKSLAGIPQAYQLSITYGRNVLNGRPSPAGLWRVRTVKAWIRSNPPVGALGDKERPATSYVIVATRAADRYFDLDAVRSPAQDNRPRGASPNRNPGQGWDADQAEANNNTAGAPPRDWVHTVDLILDAELDRLARKPPTHQRLANGTDARPARGKTAAAGRGGNWDTRTEVDHGPGDAIGARGVHLRRALERAGILTTAEALDVSPKGYSGAHYAVWPPELVRLLLAEMCPARVCTTCGHPSRRITDTSYEAHGDATKQNAEPRAIRGAEERGVNGSAAQFAHGRATKHVATTGWSDCGHGTWRAGVVLDSFMGSGTTAAVASGMGFDSIGIDIDYRNASLALDRVGMFLDVWWPDHNGLPALPTGGPAAGYREWLNLRDDVAAHILTLLVDLLAGARHEPPPDLTPARARARTTTVLAGQGDLFPTPEETPA